MGTVTHFFDKIGVAIIELSADLAVGDTIRFVRGGEELFEEKIESMQIDHNTVDTAKAGDVIGFKSAHAVKSGADVYKVH